MSDKKKLTLEEIPAPPEGSVFKLQKLETIVTPHPYCITPAHVGCAADRHGGILDAAAIEDAENRGAVCAICRCQVREHLRDRILKYSEHEQLFTLFIELSRNDIRTLNEVPGLHPYLLKLKEANLGIDGFAFPPPQNNA